MVPIPLRVRRAVAVVVGITAVAVVVRPAHLLEQVAVAVAVAPILIRQGSLLVQM